MQIIIAICGNLKKERCGKKAELTKLELHTVAAAAAKAPYVQSEKTICIFKLKCFFSFLALVYKRKALPSNNNMQQQQQQQ